MHFFFIYWKSAHSPGNGIRVLLFRIMKELRLIMLQFPLTVDIHDQRWRLRP